MDFQTILKEGCFSAHLSGNTKAALIEELLDLLVAAGKIPNRDDALAAIMAREEKMSTGMQFGVAIPHGKVDSMTGLATVVGLKREGADFDALDGEVSRIFVMTVSSSSDTGPHIQYLSEISKLLNSAEYRTKLLACETEEEMRNMLSGDASST